jgi:hypothetical protein
LIQKIYEVDPLTCPKCSGKMKVISVIEEEEIIKKILKYLGLSACAGTADRWEIQTRPPPRGNTPPNNIEPHLDYSNSQLPSPARHRSRPSEAGGSYDYLYADEQYPEGPSV